MANHRSPAWTTRGATPNSAACRWNRISRAMVARLLRARNSFTAYRRPARCTSSVMPSFPVARPSDEALLCLEFMCAQVNLCRVQLHAIFEMMNTVGLPRIHPAAFLQDKEQTQGIEPLELLTGWRCL